jgi:Zn-dependent protease with chaperone function
MTEVQGVKLGLQEYIERRKKAGTPDEGDGYAFSGDLKVLRTMRRLKPVELAVAATVRLFNSIVRNQLLGGAVLVTPKQFPKLYHLSKRCAEILGVPEQQMYVVQALGSINAMTMGTNEESVVIIHSATVDHLTEEELLFVIGHEFGHIQNNHAVYKTALYFLLNMVSAFVQWIVTPAILALNHWSRRAEITADRAGLLCCQDLEVAQRAMAKIALGSKELYEQLDLEEYLKQLEQSQKNFGRVAEFTQSHPYVTKRIEAMRLFAKSSYYRRQLGIDGGTSKADLDDKVSDIVRVW